MAKRIKRSRKTKHIYILQDARGQDVNIDLNNYRVICNKTGNRKSFYHKYLFNLIQRKDSGNIDRFRNEYVSREAAPSAGERRVEQLQQRINRLRSQLDLAVAEQKHLINS